MASYKERTQRNWPDTPPLIVKSVIKELLVIFNETERDGLHPDGPHLAQQKRPRDQDNADRWRARMIVDINQFIENSPTLRRTPGNTRPDLEGRGLFGDEGFQPFPVGVSDINKSLIRFVDQEHSGWPNYTKPTPENIAEEIISSITTRINETAVYNFVKAEDVLLDEEEAKEKEKEKEEKRLARAGTAFVDPGSLENLMAKGYGKDVWNEAQVVFFGLVLNKILNDFNEEERGEGPESYGVWGVGVIKFINYFGDTPVTAGDGSELAAFLEKTIVLFIHRTLTLETTKNDIIDKITLNKDKFYIYAKGARAATARKEAWVEKPWLRAPLGTIGDDGTLTMTPGLDAFLKRCAAAGLGGDHGLLSASTANDLERLSPSPAAAQRERYIDRITRVFSGGGSSRGAGKKSRKFSRKKRATHNGSKRKRTTHKGGKRKRSTHKDGKRKRRKRTRTRRR